MCPSSGCKDIWIRKSEFVPNTQFLKNEFDKIKVLNIKLGYKDVRCRSILMHCYDP